MFKTQNSISVKYHVVQWIDFHDIQIMDLSDHVEHNLTCVNGMFFLITIIKWLCNLDGIVFFFFGLNIALYIAWAQLDPDYQHTFPYMHIPYMR